MLPLKNILIVDDEVGVRQTLIRGIRRKFNKTKELVTITEASNGKEAIQLATNFCPDLILMDIRMPIMDGLKACRILRGDSKFAATTIIMLTCEITEEGAGLQSGADDYVIKPFNINTLLIRIERGLFKSPSALGAAIANIDDVLSKECFLSTELGFEIARAQRYQHPLSILMIKIEPHDGDLSNQKSQAEIERILRRRSSDKIIKWDENTYALLLSETNSDDAALLAKRISWHLENNTTFLRPYVGIANLEDTLSDDLICNAESSLSEAVRTGNIILNRCTVYYESIN